MNFPTLFRGFRKGFFLLLPLMLLGGYSVHNALSHYTGAGVQGVAEFGGCNYGSTLTQPCHGENSTNSTIIHLLMPDKIYAGHTYVIGVSVSNPTHPLDLAAGFDLDVDTPATLDTLPNMNTQVTPAEFGFDWAITHTLPQTFSIQGDSAVWTMLYTARPTAGIDTIFIAANAVVSNDSANPDTNDNWNEIIQYVNVLSAPSGVSAELSANSVEVFPNPASNEMYIDDGKAADVGSFTVTDASGRVVRFGQQIVLDGRHSVDISSISAGAYILNVQPRMGQSFTRRIVIRR